MYGDSHRRRHCEAPRYPAYTVGVSVNNRINIAFNVVLMKHRLNGIGTISICFIYIFTASVCVFSIPNGYRYKGIIM